jgi:type I restriction enzyme, S subunit
MIRLRADPSIISPRYLYYALSNPAIRDELRTKAKGSAGTMPKINQKVLSDLSIPYCSPEFQEAIGKRLDTATSVIEASELIIAEEMQRAKALRQSILKRAFSGQLVPQDPADEPTAALLARLHVASEAANTRRKQPA